MIRRTQEIVQRRVGVVVNTLALMLKDPGFKLWSYYDLPSRCNCEQAVNSQYCLGDGALQCMKGATIGRVYCVYKPTLVYVHHLRLFVCADCVVSAMQ